MTQAPRKPRDERDLEREQMLRGEAETLNAVALDLAAELDLQALVQKVTDAGTQLTAAQFGAFFYNMVNDDGEAYQLYTLSGAPREAFSKFGMPRNTPVFARTFSGEGVVRVDDITKDPRYGKMAPHHGMPKGHLPVRSYLAVPVVSRSGEVLGGLFFGHGDVGVFTERAERLARGIAAQAAIAIDNAQLYARARREIDDRKQIEQRYKRSHDTFLNLIQNAPFGVYLVDSQFRLVQVSAGSQKVFKNVHPLIGRDFGEIMRFLWPEPFASEAIDRFRHTLATGEPYRSADFIEKRADIGEEESYDWQIERVTLPDGTFGVVCYFYDMTQRNRAERALRDSEERFRTLSESAPVGIFHADAAGQSQFVNQAWSEMSGQAPEASHGTGWNNAIHPDDRQRIYAAWFDAVEAKRPFAEEFRFLRPDGRVIWVEASAVEMCDIQGKITGYIGTVTDVTARRDAAALLEGSIDALTSHIAILDRRGVILKVNKAWRHFAEHNGFEGDGFGVGANYLEACRPHSHDGHCDLEEQHAADGIRDVIAGKRENLVLEYPCHSPVEHRWFVMRVTRFGSGEELRIVVSHEDVTQRHEDEERIRESEANFRNLADNISQFAWMCDSQGEAIWYNQRWYEYTGATFEQMKGWGWTEVHHPDHVERVTEKIQQHWDSGEPWEDTFPLRGKDGEYRWFLSRANPIKDGEGRIVRWFGTNTDITEQLETEAALRESEERFTRFMQNLSGLAWIKDHEGRYVFVNDAAERAFGRKRAELYGKRDEDVFPPETAAQFSRNDRQALEEGKGVEVIETLEQADGVHHSLVSKFAIPDPSGRSTLVGGMAIDITDRLEAEQALRDSEEQFRRAIEEAPVPVIMHAEDGEVLQISRAWTELTGYTLDDAPLFQAWLYNAYGTEDTQVRDAVHDQFSTGDDIRGREFAITTRSGQERVWVFSASSPGTLRDGRRFIVGMAQDITDRTRAESKLRESEARFRQVAESLPQMVWTCAPDGQCDYLSPQWVSYTGIPEQTQLGFAWLEQVHADDRQCVIDHWKATAAKGEDFRIQFRIRRHDGAYRWFSTMAVPLRDNAGTIVKWFGSNTDIEDIKEAEDALRESESRFRLMANHAPVMVWVAEQDGKCTFLSKSWCDFTGQTEESGLGWGWLDVVHPDDRKQASTTFERAHRERKPFRIEYRLRRKDGAYRWAMDAAAPRVDADGRYVGYIGSVIDITERKVAEQELRRAKNELELRVAERTAELRALTQELTQTERRERKRLAQVLHDEVQQLLAAVKMQADFALIKPGKPEPVQRVKQLADDAIAACRALTMGLSPPVLRDADLVAAMHWLSRHMQEQHGLNVQIFARYPATELQEDMRVLLFEITRELLFNVVKHSDVDEATVNYTHDDNEVCIEVADEGKGCAPDALNRPGRDSFGLFSIRERLGALGGQLETDAAPHKGVRVRIRVPVVLAQPHHAGEGSSSEPTPRAAHAAQSGAVRVLLADDHQILRQGLAELLSTQPDMYVVAQANDGLEAVELARQYLPDVVVMDITMPRLSGVEATRMIRAELPDVRVIGLSMHDHADMAAAMRDAGAEMFLNKAGPVEELLGALRGAAPGDIMEADG